MARFDLCFRHRTTQNIQPHFVRCWTGLTTTTRGGLVLSIVCTLSVSRSRIYVGDRQNVLFVLFPFAVTSKHFSRM